MCVVCSAGFFLAQETLNCTACPHGSTHEYTNGSSAIDCLCLPGRECVFESTHNLSTAHVSVRAVHYLLPHGLAR
jgi:hypothetical protein